MVMVSLNSNRNPNTHARGCTHTHTHTAVHICYSQIRQCRTWGHKELTKPAQAAISQVYTRFDTDTLVFDSCISEKQVAIIFEEFCLILIIYHEGNKVSH